MENGITQTGNGNPKNGIKKDLITCVQLTKKTRDKLAELGTKKDTFEGIILNLMNKKPCGENEIGENKSE